MLKFLSTREMGIHDPLTLRQAETTRRIFNLELSRHKDVQRIHVGSINSLDLDLVEKRYLLSGGADGYIAIHDIQNASGKMKFTCQAVCSVGLSNRHRHKFSVETVQWYPLDTGMFTSSGTDKLLKVWDTNRLKTADEYEFSGIVYSHHMSPAASRHSLIAVGCTSSTLKLVDLKSGSATHTLKGHKSSVMSVRWAPNKQFVLASGSADNKVLLWDIRSAKGSLLVFDQYNGKAAGSKKGNHATGITSHSGHVNGLQFTSDGLHLVSFGADNRVRLWNTSTGMNTMVNYGRVENEGKRTVQFSVSSGASPDLIFLPNGRSIEILNMFTGAHVDTLCGHYTQVNSCILQPDYQELYSAGTDRNILAWLPNTNCDYDDHLKNKVSEKREKTQVVPQVAATADAWSSDEDT